MVSATPLFGPPGTPLLTTAPTSPPGPSALGLTPIEAPGVQSMTPNLDEGRHHTGVSCDATTFEETSVSPESMAAHAETRSASMLRKSCVLIKPILRGLHTDRQPAVA